MLAYPHEVSAWLHQTAAIHILRGDWVELWEEVAASNDGRTLADKVCRLVVDEDGLTAGLAFHVLSDAACWLAEDILNLPRGDMLPWIQDFHDETLRRPSIASRVGVFTPEVSEAEAAGIEAHLRDLLRRWPTETALDVDYISFEIVDKVLEPRYEPHLGQHHPDAESAIRAFWAVRGGTVGAAIRLVTATAGFDPLTPARHVGREWRANVVDTLRTPLLGAAVPAWTRAWIVEAIAHEDLPLLEALLAVETVPWVTRHMKYWLDRVVAQRMNVC